MCTQAKKPLISFGFGLLPLAVLWLGLPAQVQIPKTPDSSYLAPVDQALLIFDRPGIVKRARRGFGS